MSNVRTTVTLMLVAFGSLCLLGCGALRAAGARQAHINEQMQDYSYAKPLAAIWPDARSMLFEEGYQVRGEGTTNLETEWKRDEGGTSVRYLVQGIELEGKTQVRFSRQAREQGGESAAARDFAMEWKLVQRVEPERAAKIREAADAAGESARGG